MTATLTKWYEEHGKHEIFAGGKKVQLASVDHSMVLRDDIITLEAQDDLDRHGTAQSVRQQLTNVFNDLEEIGFQVPDYGWRRAS
jgi:hypothetical protein